MKLLFDQNLSSALVKKLQDLFPGSIHVRDVGLQSASDEDVWSHASQQGFVIVSKDSDFHQRSFVFGHPPKVIWVRKGNCSTLDIETILRSHQADLKLFVDDESAAFLALG